MPSKKLRRSHAGFPTEIWELIFKKLSEEIPDHMQWFSYHFTEPEALPSQLLAIQKLRLVCRTFNNLASPLLCPYLYLDISYESIDRAKELLKNPRIARGLRGIQLSLAYRPENFAYSRSEFSRNWETKLRDACSGLKFELKQDTKPKYWEDNPSLYEKFQAKEKQEAMLSTLRNFAQYLGPVESRRGYEFFRSSHERHKEKHYEQFELLMSGSFVRQLAAALGQIRQPIALNFTDDVREKYNMNNYHLFLGDSRLADTFIQPQPWSEIKDGLLPARVLTELPIAISQAGGWLQSLKLSCPVKCCHMFPPLVPPEHSMIQLRDAFKFLRVVDVSRPGGWCMYTSALLSSGSLRYVRIRRRQSRHSDASCNRPVCERERRRARSFRTNKSTVKSLRIEHATISQAELEQMLGMLSPRCKDIRISSVRITFGSWFKIVESLRIKAGSRIGNGKCKLRFANLSGGGFPQRPRIGIHEDIQRQLAEYDEKMKRVLDYIAGKHVDKWWSV
ncbi:unnamed protein product [Clonostachys rosea]|uniref:F-box domain-containing protein n=1 Tax=Bionectria ochroleuca TaxID=29856 RepID=A0ABY6UHS6_BIOOC|nr:unnamed protein product [Clonostachys rosea]